MKVAKDLVVSLAYQVRTEDGVLVDESPVSAPLDYLHGHGSLISGLETALEGHEVGDKFDVAVGANDAYGQYDENLVQRVPKDVFMGVDELQVFCLNAPCTGACYRTSSQESDTAFPSHRHARQARVSDTAHGLSSLDPYRFLHPAPVFLAPVPARL